MAKGGFKPGVIDQFEKDVLAAVSVAKEFARQGPRDITPEIQTAALNGLGPDDVPYPPYKPAKKKGGSAGGESAYSKAKGKAGGKAGKFLWGMGKKRWSKGNKSGNMLDRRNFAWKAVSEQEVHVIWSSSGDAAEYAEAHDDGLGDMPKRTFVHLTGARVQRAIMALLKKITGENATAFTTKYGK